jgi:diketogulonate reductase-like aldo/keto reductase
MQQPTIEIAPGITMPLVGLGTWQSEDDEAYRAVEHALSVGYRQIDTATMYGNEREVGRAVAASGLPRDEVFVTTKLPPSHAGRERQTLEQSLRDLGLDQLDLWLIHWPPERRASPEVWERFLQAQRDGLVRAVGVSNYSLDQLDELEQATGVLPSVNQIPWSPTLWDAGIDAGHRARGVRLEGYSPLKNVDLHDSRILAVADAHGATAAQVVIRWHVEREILVIPKSVNPERIAENLDVFGFALSDGELAALDALSG